MKQVSSDYWQAYQSIIPAEKHIQTKAETYTVEGYNSLFRHFLARMRRKSHKRQAAVEPVIGHLKQDHRLSRNFYKGDFGDAINVMLAAAAFNFKRMMNKYKQKIAHIWLEIQAILFLNLLRKMSF